MSLTKMACFLNISGFAKLDGDLSSWQVTGALCSKMNTYGVGGAVVIYIINISCLA